MLLGKLIIFTLLMDKAPADGSAGGTGNGMGQGTQAAGTPPPPPPTEAKGDSGNALDFYGSPETKSEQATPPENKSEQTPPPPKPEETKPGVTSTGYGSEDLKEEETPAEPPAPAEPPKPAEGVEAFKELKVDGVDATYVEAFKNFAANNKLSPAQAQALLDLKLSEMKAGDDHAAAQVKAQQEKIKATRAAWGQELRNDAVFGGANFDTNVHMVNKYIAEFLPETNKHLTTNKTMLPPYVMRDLHRNAMEAYKTDTFVNGVGGDTKGSTDSYNPLDFYKDT